MSGKKKRKKYWVGIDIGGTKVLTALLSKEFKILSTSKGRVDPNKGEKQFIKTLQESIHEVLEEKNIKPGDISGIGIGCPGMIDQDRGVVKFSPNISFLKQYPLASKMAKLYRVPVLLENDVNAGLYGEYQFGAAKGYSHAAGIFLGTGVGGALILDGKLYSGADGGAGEIGHTFLNLPSFLPDTERQGTVEGLIGRLSIATEAALLVMRQKAPELFKLTEYDVKQIKSRALLKAVQAGDVPLRKLLENKARILGVAMANVVNLLNPELIVLGGGLMEALGDIMIPIAKEIMKQYALAPLVKNVKVVPAKLKDYSIVMGAAKLAYDYQESA